jgi:MFS family permease
VTTALEVTDPASTHPHDGTFASLHVRSFRLYFTGQVVSNIGTWAQRVAQDWLVLTLTGSPTAVGVTTALQFLPTVLLGMQGGLIADRFAKRRVVLTTQSSMGLCAAFLAADCLTGFVQVWHIMLIAALLGVLTAVDNPARQSFLHDMVGPDQLRNAVSLNAAVYQIGGLAGPAVSALLISVAGPGFAFAVNAVSYVAVISALAAIRPASLHASAPARRAAGQLRSALSEIRRRPELLWPLTLIGVVCFFSSNLTVTLSAYADFVFPHGAAGYGFLTCMLAVGSLLGSLISARRTHGRLRNIVELAMAMAMAQLLASTMPSLWTLGMALVLLGAVCVPVGIAVNATVQLAATEHMRGRIMGMYTAITCGSAALGGPVLGAVEGWLGPASGLVLGGVVVAVAACAVGWRLAQTTHATLPPIVRTELARIRTLVAARAR